MNQITQYTDLDGAPVAPESLTIAQVVASAYGWANGDMVEGTIDADMRDGDHHRDGIYSFGSTLMCEAAADGLEVGSAEHWQQARQRIAQLLYEVTCVHQALNAFGPTSTKSQP
jgi:hypothetical protein